ncbi:MAG TPA: MarC family protein [Candidatus Omnitrophota bacterium]|nr:MarC family protein [Candidatus Omnitrophota bacterium]
MLISYFKPYIVTFIPIFFAVDIIGTIPIFLGLTENLNQKQKIKVLTDSVIIAGISAIIFAFLGKLILNSLGITIDDFKISGGILLFILSVYLLLPGKSRDFVSNSLEDDIGIFPLATPLITGPAVLVTTIMLIDTFGLLVTLTSLILNMLVAWLALRYSTLLLKFMGSSGVKAFSKISYIFLGAIGIMIVRQGVAGVLFSF